ncbi:MAG: hypothetical protein NTW96_26415 [Planctomycetia bacterium]|nr:hypothetical protein [Planctomycetia bacterium]
MTESKIALTERLRREGRWEEASRFKDTRDFRAKGLKRSEAGPAAWEAMATAFPPLGTEPGTIPGATPGHDDEIDDDLIDLAGGQPFDFARDVVWVYGHLDDRAMTPKDAPSAGAWGLLTWARRNLSRFFETVLPKASKVEGVDEEHESRPVAKKSIAEIRAIITRMGEANAIGRTSGGE